MPRQPIPSLPVLLAQRANTTHAGLAALGFARPPSTVPLPERLAAFGAKAECPVIHGRFSGWGTGVLYVAPAVVARSDAGPGPAPFDTPSRFPCNSSHSKANNITRCFATLFHRT